MRGPIEMDTIVRFNGHINHVICQRHRENHVAPDLKLATARDARF